MSIYQQIRFSIDANAIDDVRQLIFDYAKYVGQYA